MLVTVLVWAYAHGVTSSRRIERLCRTDVAFRVICAGNLPDHVTIARFRGEFPEAVAEFFAQVLVLCARLGMGRLGTVALDGMKIAASASKSANRTEEALAEAGRGDRWRRTRRPMRLRMSCSGEGGAGMRCRRRRGVRGGAMSGSRAALAELEAEREAAEAGGSGPGARRSGSGGGPGSGPGAAPASAAVELAEENLARVRAARAAQAGASWQERYAAGQPRRGCAAPGGAPGSMATAGSARPRPRWRRRRPGPPRRSARPPSGKRTARGPGRCGTSPTRTRG